MSAVSLNGRRVAVFGANASGAQLLKFLSKQQATPVLFDYGNLEDFKSIAEAAGISFEQFESQVGAELNSVALESIELALVTPSFPIDHKALEFVRGRGIPVQGELEFVAEHIKEPLIALVGTNGKSTTAMLLTALLETSGKHVFSSHSQPLSAYLNQSKELAAVIALCPVMQLEGIHNFKPNYIGLLNVSEDFMNRYPNPESYLAIHREILRTADASTVFVSNAQDPFLVGFAPQFAGNTIPFSNQALPEGMDGAWFTKTDLVVRSKGGEHEQKYSLAKFRLRGAHNREDLAAAVLLGQRIGLKKDAVQKVIDSVSSLPGRLEFVKRVNSVAFYNDAHGENPQSIVRTLQAFTEPVILIAGGRDKNADYSPLIPHIRQRVKNLILVGEAKEKINRAIGDFTETFLVGTIEEAVILAYQKSRGGDVILMSPGCDYSDAFASADAKGEYFKKLVIQVTTPRRPTTVF